MAQITETDHYGAPVHIKIHVTQPTKWPQMLSNNAKQCTSHTR